MRRISTLPRAVERLSVSSTVTPQQSVCLFCQHGSAQSRVTRRIASFSTSSSRPARSPRSSEPTSSPDFLTRTRRRIWGTDTPPGAADPYARPAKSAAGTANSPLEEGDQVDEATDVRAYAEEEYRQQKAKLQQQVEDAPMHQDYVPATSWEGLEMVGGETEWDRGRLFDGFLPTTKYIEPAQITAAIYRATVEVFAAIGANRKPRVSKGYEVGALLSPATSASIQYTAENGAVSVTYPSAEIEAAVLKAGSAQVEEVEAILDEEIVDDVNASGSISKKELIELRATIDSWGRSWREIPLEDQKIKFAIVKRLTRLLGRPVSDHIIYRSQTVNDLIHQLAVPPPPKTLFDTLQSQHARLDSPMNVEMQGRRRTPVDKEKELGRWKLIEQELRERDLPVVGRG